MVFPNKYHRSKSSFSFCIYEIKKEIKKIKTNKKKIKTKQTPLKSHTKKKKCIKSKLTTKYT